jgi:hypothetical protein
VDLVDGVIDVADFAKTVTYTATVKLSDKVNKTQSFNVLIQL